MGYRTTKPRQTMGLSSDRYFMGNFINLKRFSTTIHFTICNKFIQHIFFSVWRNLFSVFDVHTMSKYSTVNFTDGYIFGTMRARNNHYKY